MHNGSGSYFFSLYFLQGHVQNMETSNRILFLFFSIASNESGLLLYYFLFNTTQPCSFFFNDQNSHNRPGFFFLNAWATKVFFNGWFPSKLKPTSTFSFLGNKLNFPKPVACPVLFLFFNFVSLLYFPSMRQPNPNFCIIFFLNSFWSPHVISYNIFFLVDPISLLLFFTRWIRHQGELMWWWWWTTIANGWWWWRQRRQRK